jgi:hypothetical protein
MRSSASLPRFVFRLSGTFSGGGVKNGCTNVGGPISQLGIPAELLPRIFDLFVTTKVSGKGTGLGLAVCQEIIKGHEGRIEISSQVGEGTCIRTFLPTEDRSGRAALTKGRG